MLRYFNRLVMDVVSCYCTRGKRAILHQYIRVRKILVRLICECMGGGGGGGGRYVRLFANIYCFDIIDIFYSILSTV